MDNKKVYRAREKDFELNNFSGIKIKSIEGTLYSLEKNVHPNNFPSGNMVTVQCPDGLISLLLPNGRKSSQKSFSVLQNEAKIGERIKLIASPSSACNPKILIEGRKAEMTPTDFIVGQVEAIAIKEGDTSFENKAKILTGAYVFALQKMTPLYTNLAKIKDFDKVCKHLSKNFWENYESKFIDNPDKFLENLQPHLNTLNMLEDEQVKAKVIESIVNKI